MALETRQLRYFIAVAEERHFGRAAERLMMAQPPLSQQIRLLERALGTELLTRTTRKVELNPAGELLYERGRRIIEDLQSLELDVKRVGDGLEGALRLGFTGAATYGIMPRVVREASRAFPGLALSVTGEMLTPGLVAELLEHRIDIAVLRPPVSSELIQHTVVARERIVAALPSNSRMLELAAIRMDDFHNQVLVGYPENSTVNQTLAACWLQHGIRPLYRHRVSETSTLLSLVAAGVGAALVPESATSLNLGGTVFRDVVDAPMAELAVAWRVDEDSRAVRRFAPFLEEVIRDLQGESQ
ncbi:LysR family transcriptional regulator [Subtercola frigoramans]|uniref:DNA-binding transcriptional LysR family regulator n=1 Tax=Subtercola frigoramans TaxID=120298 RepID=A0ABS2L9B8_9MICO|nr:LysR substrate-binding domain-containing protein [Subtercola frigoramans]MBM7473685.1 DNA-binding transcriptional LysR family regulator [Subtercola frigoramans]